MNISDKLEEIYKEVRLCNSELIVKIEDMGMLTSQEEECIERLILEANYILCRLNTIQDLMRILEIREIDVEAVLCSIRNYMYKKVCYPAISCIVAKKRNKFTAFGKLYFKMMEEHKDDMLKKLKNI